MVIRRDPSIFLFFKYSFQYNLREQPSGGTAVMGRTKGSKNFTPSKSEIIAKTEAALKALTMAQATMSQAQVAGGPVERKSVV